MSHRSPGTSVIMSLPEHSSSQNSFGLLAPGNRQLRPIMAIGKAATLFLSTRDSSADRCSGESLAIRIEISLIDLSPFPGVHPYQFLPSPLGPFRAASAEAGHSISRSSRSRALFANCKSELEESKLEDPAP